MRSSSGWSTSVARTGQGWKVIVPMCAAQATGDRDLGRADLVGGASRRERDVDGLDVVGRALGHPLRVERVGVVGRWSAWLSRMPSRTPLGQRSRAVGRLAQRAQDAVADDDVVLDHLELGDLGGRARSPRRSPGRGWTRGRRVPGLDLGRGLGWHAVTLSDDWARKVPLEAWDTRWRRPTSSGASSSRATEYHVLRKAGTERAFTGEYTDTKTEGVYRCRACQAELFRSDDEVRLALRVAVVLRAAGRGPGRVHRGHHDGHEARRGPLRQLRLAPRATSSRARATTPRPTSATASTRSA